MARCVGAHAALLLSLPARSLQTARQSSHGARLAQVSVTEVAKELGRRWKELSDEQKAEYKRRSAEAAASQQEEQDGEAHSGDEATGDASKGAAGGKRKHKDDTSLPLTVVRRIMLLDGELSRVSNDALLVVAHAAELFVGLLAERCARQISSSKPRRTTIKVSGGRWR